MIERISRSYKAGALKVRFRRYRKRVAQHWRSIRRKNHPMTITLVTGVQRSGTNMLMSILDRSLETDVYMEKDPRAFDRYAMRDLATIDGLVARSPASHFVIKALMEAERMLELMPHFSNTKVLWLYRNYNDMVNSYLVSWPGGRNRLEEVVQGIGNTAWQARGMRPETLAIVQRHYKPDLNDASALALFWYYRNQLFFDQQLESNSAARLLHYNALVTAPAEYIQHIADFLGVAATPAMTGMISARSVGKRPKPPIEPAIRDLCDEMMVRLHQSESWSIPRVEQKLHG